MAIEDEDLQQPADETPEETTVEQEMGDVYDRLMDEDAAADGEVPEETAAERSERKRDELGRFTRADGSTEEAPAEAPAAAAPEAQAPQQVESPFTKPPSTWRKEAQTEYDKLPVQVKAEIHRRESDFHRGIGQYRHMAEIGDAMHRAVSPFADEIVRAGGNAPALVAETLSARRVLYSGSAQEKASLVASILQDYGVDTSLVNQVLEKGPVARPQADPNVAYLSQEMQQLRQQYEALRVEPHQKAVNAFYADPKNEFASELTGEMTALIAAGNQVGRPLSLQQAYEQACRNTPVVWAKLETRRLEAERKQAADKAAAARKAGSVNVRRSGKPPVTSSIGAGSMTDTLGAAYDIAMANQS